ncbi:MAG: DUF5711 family protein [Methanoregula sp.]|nr:DUF5711 family protein [Methanoregula sp.]
MNTAYPVWSGQLGELTTVTDSSDDGTYFVAGSDTGLLRLYALERKRILWTFEKPEKSVMAVSMSGNGEYIAAAFFDPYHPSDETSGEILYFNRSGNVQWVYSTGSTVHRVAVSESGKTIFASGDSNFYSFDNTGNLLGKYKTGGTIWAVAASGDGKTGVAGSGYPVSGISVMDTNGTFLWNYSTTERMRTVDISANGEAVVGADFYRLYWLDRKGTLVWQYTSSPPFTHVAMSSDGEYCAAASQYYLRFFNRTGSLLWTYEDSGYVNSADISKNGDFVIAGTENATLLFDKSGQILWKFNKGASHVSTSHDGNYFIVSSAGEISSLIRDTGSGPARQKTPDSTPSLIESTKNQSLVPSPPQPVPMSLSIPFAALGICAGAATFFRRFT